MTALLGLAPVRSARASAANHRETISACQPDDPGVASANVTVTDHVLPLYPAVRESAQKIVVKQGTLSASS